MGKTWQHFAVPSSLGLQFSEWTVDAGANIGASGEGESDQQSIDPL